MAVQKIPPADQVRELVLTLGLLDVHLMPVDLFAVPGVAGVCVYPGLIAQFGMLDQVGEPEPAIRQTLGLMDAGGQQA